MGRDRKPKHKQSRREGVDLFDTGGESLQRRLQKPPGMHGAAQQHRKSRDSQYALQLREKQKIKRMYGSEGQFRRFFDTAQRSKGITGEALLQLLELRLDNVVYRLGYARTRQQARQFVNHGHVRVDGQRVDIPSYTLKPGQEVTVEPDLLQGPAVKENLEINSGVLPWLERTPNGGRIVRPPQRAEIDADIQEQRIVEFYSR